MKTFTITALTLAAIAIAAPAPYDRYGSYYGSGDNNLAQINQNNGDGDQFVTNNLRNKGHGRGRGRHHGGDNNVAQFNQNNGDGDQTVTNNLRNGRGGSRSGDNNLAQVNQNNGDGDQVVENNLINKRDPYVSASVGDGYRGYYSCSGKDCSTHMWYYGDEDNNVAQINQNNGDGEQEVVNNIGKRDNHRGGHHGGRHHRHGSQDWDSSFDDQQSGSQGSQQQSGDNILDQTNINNGDGDQIIINIINIVDEDGNAWHGDYSKLDSKNWQYVDIKDGHQCQVYGRYGSWSFGSGRHQLPKSGPLSGVSC